MPRPYECVRRAWHSERHHPIRGSLIKELFRLANEVHSTNTRKNREWREKLPFVVIKAEEMMYSKANSEAEYMDPNTLWKRTNDAIDAIIRKDESTETEHLLKPCIEAALSLGCIPRRASRSQRNVNPRCYLTSVGARDSIDAASASAASTSSPSDQFRSNSSEQQLAVWLSSLSGAGADASFEPGVYLNYPLYDTENHEILKQKLHLPHPFSSNWTHETSDSDTTQQEGELLIHNFLGISHIEEKDDNDVYYPVASSASDLECDLSLHLGPSSKFQIDHRY